MNIFVLHRNPETAAKYACDKHVVKMILESSQMLCSAHPPSRAPYKRTHYNHPCSVWVRESIDNYNWLLEHAEALSAEYTRRYGKVHKSSKVIAWCRRNKPRIIQQGLTPFAQAMPDQYKHRNPVRAYRAYYLGEKSRFAKWKLGEPRWWKVAQKNSGAFRVASRSSAKRVAD